MWCKDADIERPSRTEVASKWRRTPGWSRFSSMRWIRPHIRLTSVFSRSDWYILRSLAQRMAAAVISRPIGWGWHPWWLESRLKGCCYCVEKRGAVGRVGRELSYDLACRHSICGILFALQRLWYLGLSDPRWCHIMFVGTRLILLPSFSVLRP